MKLERWSLHFYRLPYAREVVWANAREASGLFALLVLGPTRARIAACLRCSCSRPTARRASPKAR